MSADEQTDWAIWQPTNTTTNAPTCSIYESRDKSPSRSNTYAPTCSIYQSTYSSTNTPIYSICPFSTNIPTYLINPSPTYSLFTHHLPTNLSIQLTYTYQHIYLFNLPNLLPTLSPIQFTHRLLSRLPFLFHPTPTNTFNHWIQPLPTNTSTYSIRTTTHQHNCLLN